ncbi:hypothetical protein BGZ63DRAFT_127536 [Mariannaea sp. PMI_226]|nr:hypothetical protein BGZ63DRAFT_127536 [Mariannaea sp. PMI_226]
MCTLTYYEHKVCKHVWAIVAEPCGPFMGFTTCPEFGDDSVKPTPQYLTTRSRPCPVCDLYGQYDRNQVRMVEAMGWGIKWGVGPGAGDFGCEIKLPGRGMCVML